MAADYFGSCLLGTWLTRPKRKRKKKDILEKARKRVVDPETILQKEFGPWSLRNYGIMVEMATVPGPLLVVWPRHKARISVQRQFFC